MRLFNKGFIVLGILVFAFVQSISAQPTVFLGAFGDYAYTDYPTTHSGDIGIHGNFDYRTLIGSVGYFNLTAFGEISIDPTDSAFSDYLAVDAHGLWYAGDNDVEVTIGSESSFAGYNGYEAYWSPHWELAYRIQRGRTSINPRITYSGYATSTHISHGAQLGITRAPKVELEYSIALGGGIDTYTDTNQTDVFATLNYAINGLSGYFLSWNVLGSSTYRASKDSEREGLSGSLSAQATLTPSSTLQLRFSPTWYWEYLTSAEQWDQGWDISARADVAVSGHVYCYAGPSVVIGRMMDPNDAPWSVQLTAGVDVSL
jgi:hypothetical protein